MNGLRYFAFLCSVCIASCMVTRASDGTSATWRDTTLPDTVRLKALSEHIWSEVLFVYPDSALLLLDEQLALARRSQALDWEADALRYQGIAWDLLGDQDRALSAWEAAMGIYGSTNNEDGKARLQVNIGILHMKRGRYLDALDQLMDAQRTADRTGNGPLAAKVRANLGAIHKDLNDTEQARQYLEEGLEAFRTLGDSASMVPLLGNLSDVYEQLGDTTRAERTLLECLRLANAVGHAQWAALAESNLGLLVQRRDPRAALEHHDRALAFFEATGDPVGRASERTHMARAWLALGDEARAEQLVREAYGIATAAEALRQEYDAAEVWYGILKRKGDVNGALRMYERYVDLRDSVVGDDQRRELMRQQFTYDFEKKEALLVAEQEKENALAKAELKRRAMQRNGLLVGLGMLAVVAVVILRQRNRIGREKARSEELLLNILPAEVAEELKGTGEAEARQIDQVTVLFTDFKGFTAMSELLSPKQLVKDLHECFSAFDRICGKHGLEKIKTIGDAYMAAGGLPTPNSTHAIDVLKAALEMRDLIAEVKARKIGEGHPYFEIRIGIHTGPVVAGIVGVKKFQYDIWGDTVNTASRMESSGEVGKVNISEATYRLVVGSQLSVVGQGLGILTTDNQQRTTTPAFTFTPRGKVQAKGKGEMDMYFVERA